MQPEIAHRPVCTACRAEKRDTNHWFLLFAKQAGDVKFLAVTEWSEGDAKDADAYACGESCTHKLVSRWFETRSFEVPVVRSETHEVIRKEA